MQQVQIYVENKLIDLFGDESITVNSSVQKIQDISSVFTDFSQTFTVPATTNNNDIFGYYYNNDLDTFNANVRVAARIEIGLNKFREGKIQLESSEVKNNRVESYKLTFYGDVVTLKDAFEDKKLSDLDYSSLNQAYDGASIQAALESSTQLDVMFPLISSSRVWSYGDATSNDISLVGNPIDYTELFPAVKDAKIFEIIESQFGVSFQGNFLTNARFTKQYTWWKNRETPNFVSEPVDLEFNSGAAVCNADIQGAGIGINEVYVKYINPQIFSTVLTNFDSYINTPVHTVQFFVDNTSAGTTWYIDLFENGIYINTFSGSGSSFQTIVVENNQFGLNSTYTFQARAAGNLTFDFEVKYRFTGNYLDTFGGTPLFTRDCAFSDIGVSINNVLDFNSTAPDMTVAEWFSGTLKQFNLTCYPIDTQTYQIEPLSDWYANGGKYDITEYVLADSINYSRPKLYNELTFEYEKSQSFLNEVFNDFNARRYGDLRQVFTNHDGGKYEVKVPFENLLFQKFTGENLQVAYSLTRPPDHKPYIPKPVKLYLYDNQNTDVSFYFDNGSTVVNITNYMPFGSEIFYNASDYSINFGQEISTLNLTPTSNSLYNTFYKPYLLNLFDSKTRIVTCKAQLPITILTDLSLDDAIFIRDKKYRINEMKTDITTGLVNFELISDWNAEPRKFTGNIPTILASGGTIVVPVKPTKGGTISIDAPLETQFVTSSISLPATRQAEQNWEITIPTNGTGADRTNTIVYRSINLDGTTEWTETISIVQQGSSDFLLTESGGYLLTESLDRILI